MGHDVVLPSNDLGAAYKKLLEEDEGVWELMATKKNKKKKKEEEEEQRGRNGSGEAGGACDDINLKVTYRPLLCTPQGLAWRFLDQEVGVDVGVDGGGSVDIELTFTLPPGSFATMLVREIMETDAEEGGGQGGRREEE